MNPEWFYGRNTVLEMLRARVPAAKVWLSAGAEGAEVAEILRLAQGLGLSVQRVPKEKLESLARGGKHQGVALETAAMGATDFKAFLGALDPGPLTYVCLLDGIQDPQNLGAIARSAACFGCSGIVIPNRRSARLTPSVLKASSGAAARIPLVEIANLGVAIERLKERGFWIAGADASSPHPLPEAELRLPLAIVLGNEHEGVKPLHKRACDLLISIPQTRAVASLNVSNAAAVIFYEVARRAALGKIV